MVGPRVVYSFGPHWTKMNGKWYLGACPSKKSMQRFKNKVSETLVPANVAPWEDIRDQLNSMLLGWSNYFSYGALARAYNYVDWHVYQRARDVLTQLHKVQGRVPAWSRDTFLREDARSVRHESRQ